MKNKFRIFLLNIFMVAFCVNATSQNVTINAEIDSFQRLIGEQARIKLEVTADSKSKIIFPAFDDNIVEGVEIVHKAEPDTQYLNNKKLIEITKVYTVTSFDSSLYVIPPFEVLVDSTPYYSKELALAVYTMPIDTTNLDAFFGPKDIWRTKLMWDDCKYSVLYFVLFLLFVAAFVWVLIRYLNNKPIIRIVKIKPEEPPHTVAFKEFERIKGDGKWRDSGMTKEYYTELTDALREYMNRRFDFNATEMTTSEIVENLLRVCDKESIKELHELLVMADLVKFAKYEPAMNENDRNIVNAIEFVNNTKIEVAPESLRPVEKKIVNHRSKRQKMLLLVSVALLAVAAIALLVLLIYELYYLFA